MIHPAQSGHAGTCTIGLSGSSPNAVSTLSSIAKLTSEWRPLACSKWRHASALITVYYPDFVLAGKGLRR
jgi:hypothetical protein